MPRLRSHSRASSRGSDFFDGAVSFHQDDGSFADRSEEDEVMELPQRPRCRSLSRLDSMQKKFRLEFEEPFFESKQVADHNMQQLLQELLDHRVALDAVNPELFKKVQSTGIYFLDIDVQVWFDLSLGLSESRVTLLAGLPQPPRLHAESIGCCGKHLRFLLPVARRAHAKYVLATRFIPLIFCHLLRMLHPGLLPQPLLRDQRVHAPRQHLLSRPIHDDRS